MFDEIVATAPHRTTNPWHRTGSTLEFAPDYDTLGRLLGVPVWLEAPSQSGVPALAIDVWTAYELRRAGFEPDRVWPRASPPRVLPPEVSSLLASVPADLRRVLTDRLARSTSGGTVASSAHLLGKNYVKQVDVVISSWQTGPELMISTKRMDSSFGKNAANRIEESYGDAKNLSLRHPQAALGFLYALHANAFVEEPDTAEWLLDLLAKLAREPDAYDAVGVIVPDAVVTDPPPTEQGPREGQATLGLSVTDAALPVVALRHDLVPHELSPDRFFEVMAEQVLAASPVNFHREARRRRREAGDREISPTPDRIGGDR